MKAEKLLNKNGLNNKLIPTPREFSSDCGISIRFLWEFEDKVKEIIIENSIEYDAVHRMPDGKKPG